MIEFDEIDERLRAIGFDRAWLAKTTGRSENSVRLALAPNSPHKQRSSLLQKALSDAIEREEAIRAGSSPLVSGVYEIRQTPEQTDLVDRASRAVGAESLADFCLQAIIHRANEIISGKIDPCFVLKKPSLLSDNKPTRESMYTAAFVPTVPIVPLISLPYYGRVAAGKPAGELHASDDTMDVPGRDDAATHYVLKVDGESMAPTYPHGSHIVCRKLADGEYAKKGQDVIACDSAGSYFKRLIYSKTGIAGEVPRKATPRLVSINPDYDEVIPLADCPVVAVVVAQF